MRVAFEVFRGGLFAAWQDLYERAAAFATQLGPQRVINISQSCDHSQKIVTVWYWTE